MIDDVVNDAGRRMDKTVENTRHEFTTIRTGRASAALLERVQVDAYGTKMPVNQVATISVPEPRLLTITPFDKSIMRDIEKSILESDLGLTPNNDGQVIRLPIPELTEERRKELVKQVHHRAEEGRVAVRNVRRHHKDELEKLEREGSISEDDLARSEKELQKLTDRFVAEIDEIQRHKEQELMEV